MNRSSINYNRYQSQQKHEGRGQGLGSGPLLCAPFLGWLEFGSYGRKRRLPAARRALHVVKACVRTRAGTAACTHVAEGLEAEHTWGKVSGLDLHEQARLWEE